MHAALSTHLIAVSGTRVPAGKHRVEFRYRPGSVYWGAGLTAMGLALAASVALKEAGWRKG